MRYLMISWLNILSIIVEFFQNSILASTRAVFERDIIFFFLAKVISEASGPMQVDPIQRPITWWVSSRAEISARLTGLKFQTGFWNKSSENQVVDYMESDSARGAIQPGLKILAQYSQTGQGFSALPNGLKNPCNRYHFFSPGWKRSASMRIYCVFAPR